MKNYFYLALGTCFLSTQAVAGTIAQPASQKNWTWVGSIAAGSTWAGAGDTQTLQLAPDIEKTYRADPATQSLATGALFIGLQTALASMGLLQIGVEGGVTGNAELQGEIWDDADPQFNNYSYHYKIRTNRIAAKGKLMFDGGYWCMPWVSASMGVGFNYAHGYKNSPLIFQAVPNANFKDNTTTAFTYTLGAGVEKKIDEHWQVGAGYEFADWGKSELGAASGQTSHTGLALSHLYTNGFLFNLTYAF